MLAIRVPEIPHTDVMPDGQKFVVNSLGDEGRRPLTLVTNWRSTLHSRRCQVPLRI